MKILELYSPIVSVLSILFGIFTMRILFVAAGIGLITLIAIERML